MTKQLEVVAWFNAKRKRFCLSDSERFEGYRAVCYKDDALAVIAELEQEARYWLEVSVGYAQELSGQKNDYPHQRTVNGVDLSTLEKSIKEGYQTSSATQLDMISLMRRTMDSNAELAAENARLRIELESKK